MILTSMKKIKYFIIALCILGSCNEKSNEDMFFSELSDIVEDGACRIGQNRPWSLYTEWCLMWFSS